MNTRKIIHIDMDCFYAAIEMRDFPELRSKPIAVGGESDRRGVICTCNYEARKYGVRSAMPSAHAFRLCPNLILQPIRMDIYKEESRYIREIFKDYTEVIEPLSLDEAFLDVSDCLQCGGSATWIAKEIRERIYQTRGLTASAGIAPNKSLAKIASDWHKPNGQKVIAPADVKDFMLTLPARKLFGVGPVMEHRLLQLGVKICKDLQTFSRERLHDNFGAMGERLYDLARGIDERAVNPSRIRKSISVEETYPHDLPTVESCFLALPNLLTRLENRIEKSGHREEIHNLFVKIKFNNFAQTTIEMLACAVEIEVVQKLLRDGWQRQSLPVRLLGIGVRLKKTEQETEDTVQLDLPI